MQNFTFPPIVQSRLMNTWCMKVQFTRQQRRGSYCLRLSLDAIAWLYKAEYDLSDRPPRFFTFVLHPSISIYTPRRSHHFIFPRYTRLITIITGHNYLALRSRVWPARPSPLVLHICSPSISIGTLGRSSHCIFPRYTRFVTIITGRNCPAL